MNTVVVIGMHSGGTSLVASILDALGVQMNPNPRAKVRWYQNYEDVDFVRLNIQILNKCGGEWKKAPSYESVSKLVDNEKLMSNIESLVNRKTNGKLWGFKDPRTALTIQLIHPFLIEPGYIRVTRPYSEIAQSIMRRGANSTKERWVKLARDYNEHIDTFLSTVDSPVLIVPFGKLLDKKQSKAQVKAIADFVGIDKRINKAVERINYARK